jgi:hypothetical protein
VASALAGLRRNSKSSCSTTIVNAVRGPPRR